MRKLRRNECRLRLFCVVLIFVGGCGSQFSKHQAPEEPKNQAAENIEAANETKALKETPGEVSKTDLFLHSAEKDLAELPGVVIDETKQIFTDWDNLWPLAIAGGASIVMHNTSADREIAENFDMHRTLGKEIDEIVSNVGGPGFHFGAAGLWYAIAAGEEDEFNKQRAWTMLKALSVTGATTLGLKLIRNDRTPNDKWLAWPSGHTSSSFTVAAVLDEFYGPEIGTPAYLAAGFVGYRMMDSGDHWASDVVFGAVLGYLVGHHIAGKHIDLEVAGFEVVPYTNISGDESVMGVALTKQF